MEERIDEILAEYRDKLLELFDKTLKGDFTPVEIDTTLKQAILTAVAESLPPAKSDKGVFKLDYELVAEIYGWNAYRNEVLAQLGKEKR